jgi:ubiquinone/menaquinone biosynthesis C-methylase UbiE
MGGSSSASEWDAIADAWDRHVDVTAEHVRPVTRKLLRMVAPGPGESVLEVACGAGDLGVEIARAVGDSGRVLLTDGSPRMLEHARRRVAALELSNLEFEVMDGEALRIRDESFDAVVCRFGYMLMPEPEKGFAEARRVLKQGGRIGFAVWGPAEKNPWLVALGMAAMQNGVTVDLDPFGPGGPFSLAEPDRVESLLHASSFEQVDVQTVDIEQRYANLEDYWSIMSQISGPLATALGALDQVTVGAVKDSLRLTIGAFEEDGGYILPGVAIVATAR